jgi:hypothetical protein
LAAPCAGAASDGSGADSPLLIPRLEAPPTLEDFLEMKPSSRMQGRLAKVEGFLQREPRDGEPSTQRTEVYLGYDDKHLYVIFVAFDSEPRKVRARMARRENLNDEDDWVEVALDTFHDQRRGYLFDCNPLGVQWDALWSEATGEDSSFDTLWNSRGSVTSQGYVVWMAIPFKSLRFSSDAVQTWGILLTRWVPRLPEKSSWPRYSSRIEGRMNQAALLGGLETISPGRNILFIPYGLFRAFQALDSRDPNRPVFAPDSADINAGLDAKFVIKDSLVLDLTVNPDFSQVESDQPQVTVNQRFELFFPEKRPFFIENSSFFRTPIDLLFTRRIADPQFGARLTGKLGRYSLGALFADDQAPGKLVPHADPLRGKRAYFGVARVSRDIFRQSSIGAIFTDREFQGGFNRVSGVDGRFKFGQNWVTNFQAVTSSTRRLDGTRLAGPAYHVALERQGRKFNYEASYQDRSPGFLTQSGFVSRTDIREFTQEVSYTFRPEGKFLISWGPDSETTAVFDHSRTRLDFTQGFGMNANFIGQTKVGFFYDLGRERLRPQDFPGLPANRDFASIVRGFYFGSSYFRRVGFSGEYFWGKRINIEPPAGLEPYLADRTGGSLTITLRPFTRLTIENSYLLERLLDSSSRASIFNNHIARSKWNWQFTRELSFRAIFQYDAVLASQKFTALHTTKNFNADFLITYLVNPWTALYVGYNSNLQNLFLCEGPGQSRPACPVLGPNSSALIRPQSDFSNDARQFFVKFSYLLRF